VTKKRRVSFDEFAHSSVLIVQALVEMLSEKGFLDETEILQRVEKLKQDISFSKSPRCPAEPIADPRTVVVSIDDLISSNKLVVEMLLAILVDKAFLTQEEMEELLAEVRKKAAIRMRRQ
jgi:hypothetical protein